MRPWATVLRAPTTAGPVWLKATGPGTAAEAGLYELLVRVAPERVLAPLAVDAARGWILLPDGGPPLADRVAGGDLAQALAAILPRYAELQRAFAPEAERAPRPRRRGHAPRADAGPVRGGARGVADHIDRHDDAGDRDALRRVAAMRETYRSWCERLAAAPGPASIDHNDLHTGTCSWRIRAGRTRSGSTTGETRSSRTRSRACSSRSPGRSAGLRVDLYAAEMLRIRDAYLEPFGDLGPRDELVEALELPAGWERWRGP